jgi:hypothetical protein
LALFWVWLERWLAMDGWSYDESLSAFTLSSNASARFLLGTPRPGRGASGRPIFLGVQHEEEQWISRMGPSRVVFDAQAAPRHLWLVFSGMASPDQAWPDLPPVVVGIQIYAEHLVQWQGSKLDLRSVWWEEDETPRVTAAPLASLAVQHGDLLSGWKPSDVFVKSLRDRAIESSEAQLLARGLDHNPGYEGQAPQLDPSQRNLVAPFAGPAPEIVEANYHGLFGQFIDGVEPGPRRR